MVPNLAAIVLRESFLSPVFFLRLLARSEKEKPIHLNPTQDGSYLSELLLDKGYVVHGLKRRASSYNHPRIEHIMDASESFFSFFFSRPPGCKRTERENLLTRDFQPKTKKHRLPRLGALLPPLRRPDRLWLALPAAQVRGKREKRAKRRAYFERGEEKVGCFFESMISALVARNERRRRRQRREVKKLTSFFAFFEPRPIKSQKQRDQARRDLQPRRAVARPGLVPAPSVHRRGLRSGEFLVLILVFGRVQRKREKRASERAEMF